MRPLSMACLLRCFCASRNFSAAWAAAVYPGKRSSLKHVVLPGRGHMTALEDLERTSAEILGFLAALR
jgi:hypothetical protein